MADALQNCLQDLTSRIAGVDNEQMTGRVLGMGAMMGFGLGAIKEQFNSPSPNIKTGNSNDGNAGGGFKGFISRAKAVVNPSINLSAEKDYNGNINPIRNVIPNEKSSKVLLTIYQFLLLMEKIQKIYQMEIQTVQNLL